MAVYKDYFIILLYLYYLSIMVVFLFVLDHFQELGHNQLTYI